jgi:hypothetical protein
VTPHDGSSAAGRRRAAVRDPEDQLVARLTALRGPLDGEPHPQFRAATRARLVAMAAVRSPAPESPSGLRRWLAARPVDGATGPWRGRLTAGLAGAAVAVTALATLVGVSTGATPGDPLYGLKRETEQTQLALAADSTRGQTLLDFASTRLTELGDLLDQGTSALPAGGSAGDGGQLVLAAGASSQLVQDTLRAMDQQTADGTAWLTARAVQTGTTAPLEELTRWAGRQSTGLSALVPEVPQDARTAMASSLVLLTQVTGRGQALETAFACPAGPATAGSDALGPQPVACPRTPSSASSGGSVGGPTTAPVPGTQSAPTAGPDAPVPGGGTGTTTATATTPPGNSGSGSGGGGSSGRTGTPTIPSTVPTVPGLPTTVGVPSLPLPLPAGGSAATSSPSTGPSSSSPPPLIHTPLPICLPPIIC